jgi:hypothetical protein
VVNHPVRTRDAGVRNQRSSVSDEQHMALPQLYGGPAYSRPPRPVQEIVRPFDPDELPIEAERTEGEIARDSELAGSTWATVSAPAAKPKGIRRSRAGKAAKVGQAAASPAVTSPAVTSPAVTSATVPSAAVPSPVAPRPHSNGSGELQGRPFSLRNLGRIFGGDHK